MYTCRWVVQGILFVCLLMAIFGPQMTWRYFIARRIASRLGIQSFFELNTLVVGFLLLVGFFLVRWSTHAPS
ncbi:hypothetical protein SAMN05216409_104387 [Pseudomonas lutea]|uniref:Uncharacterized protein n=1 Tax=Pseudomonas lutea TaxID=243924 RepID=A0A9X8MBH3_9PSED|nr:hypothetical protein SAMN05216409_104387 [Pseudomonas lutea]